MVVRKKTAAPAPAKKAVTATARTTTTKTAAKPAPAPRKATPPAAPKLTSHDVLRARAAAKKAQDMADELERQYWAANDAELDDAAAAGAKILEDEAPAKRTGRKPAETPSAKARASKPVAGEFYDLDKVSAMGIKEIRELAADLIDKELITEPKLKKEIIAQMTAAGLFREAGSGGADDDDAMDDDEALSEDSEEFDEEDDTEDDDESEESDDDDEDESDEDDDDEGEGYSKEELQAMKLSELQDLAEQNDIDVEDMSKKEIVEALWERATDGADDDEDEDDEEPEDDDYDEEEDEDDEDTIEIDLDELKKQSAAEIYALAKKIDVKIPVAKRNDKKLMLAKIEDFLTEDDE